MILDAGDAELFKISRTGTALPAAARIYQSVRCEMCGEKVAEPKARLRDGKTFCIPCFERGE